MAGESGDFLRRLRRALADWTAWKVGQRVERVQQAGRDLVRGGRFTCACCPGKAFRGHRALNAHHLARHGGYWGGNGSVVHLVRCRRCIQRSRGRLLLLDRHHGELFV